MTAATLLTPKAAKTIVKAVRPKSLRAILMTPVMLSEVRKGNITVSPDGQVMGTRAATERFAQASGHEVAPTV